MQSTTKIPNIYKLIFIQGLIIWGLATTFYFFDNLLNGSPSAMKAALDLPLWRGRGEGAAAEASDDDANHYELHIDASNFW